MQIADHGDTVLVEHPRVGHLVAFYAACLFGAAYAQLLATIPGTGVSVWLPSGLLLGALLANARTTWLWWIAVAIAAELTGNLLWFGNSLTVTLLIAAGNTAESLLGAILIGRLIAWPFRFAKVRDVVGFVLLGVILAPLAAATIGGLTLVWAEGQPLQRAFSLLWIGDATGILIAAPAVLTVADSWRQGVPKLSRVPEAMLIALSIAAIGAASLTGRVPFGLIFIPLVLIAAARFYFWGSTLSALGLTALIALFEMLGVNPFALVGSGLEANVQEQMFLAVATLTALVVAALAKQNAESLEKLVDANRQLEMRVLERTARLSASESRLKKVMDTAQIGIAFADRKGTLTGVNTALAKLLDRSAAELERGRIDWNSVLSKPERELFASELSKQEAGAISPLELNLIRPAGDSVPVILAASQLDDGEYVAFIVDQSKQKQHEEQIRMLMGEAAHRAKNILAVVQSVAHQTRADSIPEFLERFDKRLQALSALQNLLVANNWSGAPLDSVVREQLAHLGDALDTRIKIDGPALMVTATAAQTVALAIHELSTNAAKYGALSNLSGTIRVSWHLLPGDQVRLNWTESGGPPVRLPVHRGFGSVVIETMIKALPGSSAETDYAADGLSWSLVGPISSFRA